MNAEDFWFEL